MFATMETHNLKHILNAEETYNFAHLIYLFTQVTVGPLLLPSYVRRQLRRDHLDYRSNFLLFQLSNITGVPGFKRLS